MAKNDNKQKKHFFKELRTELKKVVWPTPKQLVNNTVAVITIVLITAVIVFVLDLVFDFANKQGIEKVKEVITSSNTANTTESNTGSEEGNTTSEETEAKPEETQTEVKEEVKTDATNTEAETVQNN